MNTSRTLKIWTLVTNALIIVGWGHGILFYFLIEIFYLPDLFKQHSPGLTSDFDASLPLVGLWMLLGQLLIVISMVIKQANYKIISHVIGIMLLWISIVYFTYAASGDRYTHFATVTALPFAFCTVITFVGRYIRNYWKELTK